MSSSSSRSIPDRKPRILIAEDDRVSAAILQTLLTGSGYEVEIVVDGSLALQALDAGSPPDILILDWMLPGVTGLEICHSARKRWDPLTLPILMVTARADAESISAAFDAGASDYLTKPFLGAELRSRVAQQLRMKEMVEERRRINEHLMEREKLSVLGLLVSGVAHDLNNPLGGITGFTQLLLEDETDPEKVDSLRRILDEVRRCNRIVTDLLSFARNNPPLRQPVDIRNLMEKTLEMRARAFMRAKVETSMEFPEEWPVTIGDEHQLQQVFLNILINAEQALNGSGGGGVNVRGYVEELSANGSQSEGHLVVCVANDGPPIPVEVLPRLFDPFFTTKGKDEGTGLGLAICQRIVSEHGGKIEVRSDAGGTEFRVLLPISN